MNPTATHLLLFCICFRSDVTFRAHVQNIFMAPIISIPPAERSCSWFVLGVKGCEQTHVNSHVKRMGLHVKRLGLLTV